MPNLLIRYECNYFEDTLINFEEEKATRKNTTIVLRQNSENEQIFLPAARDPKAVLEKVNKLT